MSSTCKTTSGFRPIPIASDGHWPPSAEINDYGIIGNCRSAALVSRYGSIDWLCWPRFDSASLFAGLLDPRRGGAWRICTLQPATIRRQYLYRTNILTTRFTTSSGVILLTDFMPVASEEQKHSMLWPENEITRQVECEEGEVEIEFLFDPHPDYGRARFQIVDCGRLGYRFQVGASVVTLLSEMPLKLQDSKRLTETFRLTRGQFTSFSLTYSDEAPAVLAPLGDALARRRELTMTWWRQWVDRARYAGPYSDQVIRSALTLKLLSFAPSGALVAAPTTSLPEKTGGDFNWDYRYCWLRDAAFTARALFGLGYEEDAQSFVSWMLHATRLTRPELRIIYDVFGERPPRETVLEGFSGYADSAPVRVGNGARDQVQLDVYGEAIDAVVHFFRSGANLDRETRKMLCQFGEYVCRHWNQPDYGIWEERTSRRHYTHSKLLCWVALDRLVGLCEAGQLPALDVVRIAENRELVRTEIETCAWNADLGSYVRFFSGRTVDATLLLMGLHRFHDPASERMQQTYRRVKEKLAPKEGILYRYEEGISAGEGAFAMCGFWEADFAARGGGTAEEGHHLFRAAARFSNDLGLFAEEIDSTTGDLLGNFPQAFTHLGLINAAISLARRDETEAGVIAGNRREGEK